MFQAISNSFRHGAADVRIRRDRSASLPASLALVVGASFLFAACTGGAADTPAASDSGISARSADAAPDFELEVFGNANHARGELVRLSQFEGHPVVINFWYPSCPPCRLEMPHIEQAFNEHNAVGVEFIGVELLGLDSAQDGQEFVDEFGLTFALGPDTDGSIVVAYEVPNFPTTVFLDRNHEVVRSWTGALTKEKIDEIVQELLQ